MRHLKTLLCLGILTFCFSALYSQKKLFNQARGIGNAVGEKFLNKKADEAVNGQTQNTPNAQNGPGSTGSNSRSGPSNKGGGGLMTTPPDVNENLASAETAFKGAKYGDARYAVQQAMLGVELQIGQQILKSMPETVGKLKKDTTMDQVTSTGFGWSGLTIQRVYREGEQQFTVTIANNAVWMNALNLYFNNTGYAQTTNGQQKMKQIMVKGSRALIEYDESSGYKVSVALGQTSLVVMDGINFASEKDMMAAVNSIDLDGIKASLGEK
jgi:hypothetical protein